MEAVKLCKRTVFELDLGDSKVAVPFEPIPDTVKWEYVQGTICMAYLTPDYSDWNPFEDWDCMGKIIVARRDYATREDMEEFYEALGLDSDGSPNIEACREGAEREYHNRHGKYADEVQTDEAYEELRTIAKDIYSKRIQEGSLGNLYARVLDVFEHGTLQVSMAGSVQGYPFNCRWDATRGGGIWIPDEGAVTNIQMCAAGKAGWKIAYTGERGEIRVWHSGKEKTFKDLTEALTHIMGRVEPKRWRLLTMDAADEIAADAVETFNQWSGGEVFGVVWGTAPVPKADEVVELNAESTWQVLGYKHAEEHVTDAFMEVLKEAKKKHKRPTS